MVRTTSLLVCLLLACTAATDSSNVAHSTHPRDETPAVLQPDATALRLSIDTLGNDLLRARITAAPADNLVLSPYSISSALAMTYAGARGQTATEMAQALHYATPNPALSAAFDAVDLSLTKRAKDASQGFVTRVANALWGQKTYAWQPQFLDLLATDFGAGVHLADFTSAPEATRLDINSWVSSGTEGRIKDLLPSGSIDNTTRFVIVNAIAIHARWALPFKPAQPGTFHLPDGSAVAAPMMSNQMIADYADAGDYEVLRLPFQDPEDATSPLGSAAWSASLILIVPRAGKWAGSETWFDSAVTTTGERQVTLSMPKFSIAGDSLSLMPALSALGMKQAFTSAADFSGITTNAPLKLSDVIHQATITVDEQGVEAAAGTASIGSLLNSPPPITVVVDRPFYFVVRDDISGVALFVGRYVHP